MVAELIEPCVGLARRYVEHFTVLMKDMANIYDGAFRTILNDCRKLIIPVINEIFGETYIGDEEIRFFPNEHFLDQQDEADKERITDTNFTVFGKIPKKYHVECESSLPDGRITIRLFEYDAQIALDESEVTEETLTVTFPNTAVLYLRTLLYIQKESCVYSAGRI